MEGLVVLAFTTGARRCELLTLKWDDVDFEARQLTIKASLSQVGAAVHIKASQRLLLGESYADQGYVFAPATEKTMGPFRRD